MSDLGFLPFLFTSHNKHIEKVIYNKVFSGRLEGLLNHYRCTTKAIIHLSPVLSYIKPLRVSPARIRTLLEVSMCNHLLNNIVTAVGGWHVAKQTYLVTLVTFTVCTLVSFRRARASAGGGGGGGHGPPDKRDGRKAKNGLWRILTFHTCLALVLVRLKNAKKITAILQIILTVVL